jgi:hypothetical protein
MRRDARGRRGLEGGCVCGGTTDVGAFGAARRVERACVAMSKSDAIGVTKRFFTCEPVLFRSNAARGLVDRDTETFVLTVYVAFARSGRSTVYSGVIEAPEATKSEGKNSRFDFARQPPRVDFFFHFDLSAGRESPFGAVERTELATVVRTRRNKRS